MPDIIQGNDNKSRCWWCGDDELYMHYHDAEWGRPMRDDFRLFEKICLEGFQSGLSWLTILRKRENFRKAFDGFDFHKVALYGPNDVKQLLGDAGIIRHRGKIEATINNAARALETVKEFGSLNQYFWDFPKRHCEEPSATRQSMDCAMTRKTRADIPAQTLVSQALSKDLKKRGWKFVGPTTCYAFMQAMGMVNDHLEGCHVRGDMVG